MKTLNYNNNGNFNLENIYKKSYKNDLPALNFNIVDRRALKDSKIDDPK